MNDPNHNLSAEAAAATSNQTPVGPTPSTTDGLVITGILLAGLGIAYLEHLLRLQQAMIFEMAHALVVAGVLIFCLIAQARHPEIKQFGWGKIVWGVSLLLLGTLFDILDDDPIIHFLNTMGLSLTRTVELAFAEKILGFSTGIVLLAFGFYQWVPWMIQTRLKVERLNQRMAQSNKTLSTLMMSLDEHIESVRLNISRELHDDVAQQLTYLKVQVQLCQKELAQAPEKAEARLATLGEEVSETLRSVRQISRDLRPEALYALGLIPALEQFLDKTRLQYPDTELLMEYCLLDEAERTRIESLLDDQQLLHLFRVVQEGTRNALKHSGASKIKIEILEEESLFRFRVEDNGRGLPWAEVPTDDVLIQEGHLGIAGLRERVRELAGTFRLSNNATQGAMMEITIAK